MEFTGELVGLDMGSDLGVKAARRRLKGTRDALEQANVIS